jgi:hypothetical protein
MKRYYLGALREGLAKLGYVEGRNIVLENRFPAEQWERFVSLAAELVQLKPDLLVAVSRPAAIAAHRATTTIPIVFSAVPDPVGDKLVESLARPGGNITGLSNLALDLSAKRIELLKAMVGSLSRVACGHGRSVLRGMSRCQATIGSSSALPFCTRLKPQHRAVTLGFERSGKIGRGHRHQFCFCTSGQPPWSSGRNACSAGIVAVTLKTSHLSLDSSGALTCNKYIE